VTKGGGSKWSKPAVIRRPYRRGRPIPDSCTSTLEEVLWPMVRIIGIGGNVASAPDRRGRLGKNAFGRRKERTVLGSKHMEADMRKPIQGMIAGATVATALVLTLAVADAQAPAP